METKRLRLRPFGVDDLDVLAAMVADPDQMRFYPRPKTREEARKWIDWNLELYVRLGFGTWLLELRATDEFAGYCGIRPRDVDGSREMELAWHVKKTFWNTGVATEAAAAARERAFGALGLRRLVAVIHPHNLPSRRVAEKLGMAEEGQTTLDGEPVVVYSASA